MGMLDGYNPNYPEDIQDEERHQFEMQQYELMEEKRKLEREEELKLDDRYRKFVAMDEDEKDMISCDEIFSLYLRDVCKYVNENYYKTCLRFVLLYRECLNEYGWLKRREHFRKAGIEEDDEILNKLRSDEEKEEERQKLVT